MITACCVGYRSVYPGFIRILNGLPRSLHSTWIYQRINADRLVQTSVAYCNRYSTPRFYATDSKSDDPEFKSSKSPPRPPSLRTLTAFHAVDKLDPNEWILIYYNKEYERFNNVFPFGIIGLVVSAAVFIFALIPMILDFDQVTFVKSDLLFLGWPIGVGLIGWILTRYRRRFVLRMYQHKSSGSKKRRYCIVWLNWWLRKRKYIYEHTQTSDACERHSAIVAFFGNYKAKNRPWHVKAVHFDRPSEYFNVRVSID